MKQQRADGHWVFELEADATIAAEYVVLQHFLGEPNAALQAKIAIYLGGCSAPWGWPLFHSGAFNISASVKAYFALKLVGDAPESEHMRLAREAILAHGGAGTTNVFTRILLALFGVISWAAVPIIPVEIMLLPRWFPFHLSRVSCWSRTVLVPLLVLQALKPHARNPRGVQLDELFPGGDLARAGPSPTSIAVRFAVCAAIDAALRLFEPLIPQRTRRRAIERSRL